MVDSSPFQPGKCIALKLVSPKLSACLHKPRAARETDIPSFSLSSKEPPEKPVRHTSILEISEDQGRARDLGDFSSHWTTHRPGLPLSLIRNPGQEMGGSGSPSASFPLPLLLPPLLSFSHTGTVPCCSLPRPSEGPHQVSISRAHFCAMDMNGEGRKPTIVHDGWGLSRPSWGGPAAGMETATDWTLT